MIADLQFSMFHIIFDWFDLANKSGRLCIFNSSPDFMACVFVYSLFGSSLMGTIPIARCLRCTTTRPQDCVLNMLEIFTGIVLPGLLILRQKLTTCKAGDWSSLWKCSEKLLKFLKALETSIKQLIVTLMLEIMREQVKLLALLQPILKCVCVCVCRERERKRDMWYKLVTCENTFQFPL